MAWLDEAIECLMTRPVCGYGREGAPSVEPTALAALALLAAGRGRGATPALDWLVGAQSADGSLGINAHTRQPCWPTGWAILAWNAAANKATDAKTEWSDAAKRAMTWMISLVGRPGGNGDQEQQFVGHDATLQGWPWAAGTHSWVEPTAIDVLALRSAGQGGHPRCREAVKLLLDRQLPDGGWNYGNTTVFGHVLRPLVQPTGLALAALAGETDIRSRVQRSLDYLRRTLSEQTTTASLCYALVGLAGYGSWPASADRWLAAAHRRVLAGDGSPYRLALLVLAAKRGKERP